MKSVSLLVAALSVLVVPLAADACTLDPEATLESSFDEAAGVVLAEVVGATRTAASNDPGDPYPVENVTFKVLVIWKGSYKLGSTLQFETAIGPGSCGRSIDPDMRLLMAAPAKKLKAGGIWTLFLNGSAPYRLERPSERIGAGAERNLGRLYELSSDRSKSNKS